MPRSDPATYTRMFDATLEMLQLVGGGYGFDSRRFH
jgi:hypothetical protein